MTKKYFFALFFLFLAGFFIVRAEEEEEYYDLNASEIKMVPEKPLAGDKAIITVRIKNSGNKNIYSSTGFSDISVDFDDFNKISRTAEYPSLQNIMRVGDYVEYVYEGTFSSSGTKKLNFTIDSDNFLDEKNEENNQVSKEIYVASNSDTDLFLKSVEFTPEEIALGEEVEIDMVVKNAGNSSLISGAGLAEVDFESVLSNFSYSEKNFQDYPSIDNPFDPGDEFGIVFKGFFRQEGEQNVFFEVNSSKNLEEKDYFNNSFSQKFFIYKSIADKESFEIFDRNVENTSSTSVKISWKTTKKSICSLFWQEGNYEATREEWEKDDELEEWSKEIDDLKSNTEYTYQIICQRGDEEKFSFWEKFKTLREDEMIEDEENSETEEEQNDGPESDQSDESGQKDDVVESVKTTYKINSAKLPASLKGRIILTVEENGEAYYVSPEGDEMYYLGRPDDAFSVMRTRGVGISNELLAKIRVGLQGSGDQDSDKDGLSDLLEDALGTDKNSADSDNDGYNDKEEVESGNSAISSDFKANFDDNFSKKHSGKIFLQVETHGEAWYVNPIDNKRYFLGRPADAFAVMRELGLGVATADFNSFLE